MKKNVKEYYRCTNCNYETPQWLGRCPSCGAWNSFTSYERTDKKPTSDKEINLAKPIDLFKFSDEIQRYNSGITEFDRVLGGGIVLGSLVLIGGEPGIGKSTLVLQAANKFSRNVGKSLYITAEESIRQINMRASRLSVNSQELYLLSETDLDKIIEQIVYIKPKIAIIDSIQIINDSSVLSSPGSVNQVKSCASKLMEVAKKNNIAMIIIGHVTKGGAIAGPKILEHMVDTVLYLEGERFHSFRLLRCIKNRFGTTNELGIFQMKNEGMQEVKNPSKMLLSSRNQPIPGTVTTVTFEGSRPLAVEIEALVNSSFLTNPRRITTGVDYSRVSLIIAVLENRLGLQFQYKDIYVNAAGGIRINEPAIDLGIALAIISSINSLAINMDTVAFGELGLTGELRSVGMAEQRIKEAQKIGYKKIIIPLENARQLSASFSDKIEISGIYNVKELINIIKQTK
jgi:DNA repair protein RadA/Sms